MGYTSVIFMLMWIGNTAERVPKDLLGWANQRINVFGKVDHNHRSVSIFLQTDCIIHECENLSEYLYGRKQLRCVQPKELGRSCNCSLHSLIHANAIATRALALFAANTDADWGIWINDALMTSNENERTESLTLSWKSKPQWWKTDQKCVSTTLQQQ